MADGGNHGEQTQPSSWTAQLGLYWVWRHGRILITRVESREAGLEEARKYAAGEGGVKDEPHLRDRIRISGRPLLETGSGRTLYILPWRGEHVGITHDR